MDYTPIVPYIAHVRQRYDRRGQVWNAYVDGVLWDWSNCGHASNCMGVERGTHGMVNTVTADQDVLRGDPPPLSPRASRNESGDLDPKNPGSNVYDLQRAARAWGVRYDAIVQGQWDDMMREVRTHSRAVLLGTLFSEWPDAKSCQPGFEGAHEVVLHLLCDHPRKADACQRARMRGVDIPFHDCSNGSHALISDPLCPAPKWLAVDNIRPAVVAYGGGNGRVYALLTPRDPEEVYPMFKVRLGEVGDLSVGTPYFQRPGATAVAGKITASQVAKEEDGSLSGFPLVARSEDGEWQAFALPDGAVRWVPTSTPKNRRRALDVKEVVKEVPVADPVLVAAEVAKARQEERDAAIALIDALGAEVTALVGSLGDEIATRVAKARAAVSGQV